MPIPADDPYAQRVREQTLASYDKAAKPESVASVVLAAATSGAPGRASWPASSPS